MVYSFLVKLESGSCHEFLTKLRNEGDPNPKTMNGLLKLANFK